MPNFISLTFRNNLNGDLVVMKVYGNGEMLAAINDKYTNLEGLNWNVAAIVKEFPDLANSPPSFIRQEGLARFKKHISGLSSWEARKNSIKNSLTPYGYELLLYTTPDGRVLRK